MNENEKITEWEDRFNEDKLEVANMDRDDFLNMLIESRIIQASQLDFQAIDKNCKAEQYDSVDGKMHPLNVIEPSFPNSASRGIMN